MTWDAVIMVFGLGWAAGMLTAMTVVLFVGSRDTTRK